MIRIAAAALLAIVISGTPVPVEAYGSDVDDVLEAAGLLEAGDFSEAIVFVEDLTLGGNAGCDAILGQMYIVSLVAERSEAIGDTDVGAAALSVAESVQELAGEGLIEECVYGG